MDYPSFLFLDTPDYKSPGIPKTTLEDCRIPALFSKNVCETLMYPANAPLITARQIIFDEMSDKNGSFYANMISLKSSLVSLDSAEGGRRLSVTDAQKKFKTVRLLRAFITAIDKIKTLESESKLVLNAVSFWKNEKSIFIDELRSDAEEGEKMLSLINPVDIRLDNSGYYIAKGNREDDYVSRIEKIGESLEIETESNQKMSLQTDKAISDALREMFPKEFEFLEYLQEKYRNLPITQTYTLKTEIDFYLEMLDFRERSEKSGISSCTPHINSKHLYSARSAFDISLLHKNTEKIIPNDISFDSSTPFCFLTGANGGGKTTYLRTVVINLVLGVCGCFVYSASADIYPFTKIITHFPADERFNDTGRLLEEQNRINDILDTADADSFLCFNETFSGTDDVKGCRMTLETAEKIKEKQSRGLFVTHFHEVSKAGFPMLAPLVDGEHENARTFRIVLRDKGIDSSFAEDILKKYNLDRESLEKRTRELSLR